LYKLLLILLTPLILISSETDKPLRLGVLLGGNYIQNETMLPIVNGDTCCGEFNDGYAASFYTGLSLNYEFLPKFISADIRFLFDSRPANLTVNTNDYEVFNSLTQDYEKATVQNDLEATLNYFVFDLGFKIRPVSNIPIALRVGYDFSDASITKKYTQTRHIIDPSGVQINGNSIETVSEGDFNNLTVSQGLSGSLIGDIDLTETITLSPELSYRYPINSSMKDIDWFTTLFRAGATISVRLNSPTKELVKEIQQDTIKQIEAPLITEKIEEPAEINSINNIGIDNLKITQTVVTQTYPILPYIFFDSTSYQLSNKYYYKGDTKNFSEQLLEKNSLRIYERLIDIIGHRLKVSDGGLTIKGFTDGRELTSINDRKTLAYNRANTVKEYLISKWGISPQKLMIETEDIPDQPTSSSYLEGLAENRRVELLPDDISLLKPIVHSQFMEYATDKNKLNVDLDTKSDAIKDYTIIIEDNNNQLYTESKQSAIPNNYTINLDNKLTSKIAESDIDNLQLELLVTKHDGRIETKKIPFNVEKENNDFELGRLNLIVFDFDKSVISDANRNMIDKFIINNISNDSQIDIIGSTDFLGERLYNKDLSQKRADNVALYINTLLPDVKFNKVMGIGSENPKFDNSTPEGRFYCRTVLIEVKTPIKIN
jgi:outer membrane protein OmpA-like peptidoglycan-associated protein